MCAGDSVYHAEICVLLDSKLSLLFTSVHVCDNLKYDNYCTVIVLTHCTRGNYENWAKRSVRK